MSVDYERNLSVFDSGNIKKIDLIAEVESSSITKTLVGIAASEQLVTFEFSEALSGAEETTLDTVCADHEGYPNGQPDTITQNLDCVCLTREEKTLVMSLERAHKSGEVEIQWSGPLQTDHPMNKISATVEHNGVVVDSREFFPEKEPSWSGTLSAEITDGMDYIEFYIKLTESRAGFRAVCLAPFSTSLRRF